MKVFRSLNNIQTASPHPISNFSTSKEHNDFTPFAYTANYNNIAEMN